MRILVTGATSFTARYLWPAVKERWPGATCFGTGIEAGPPAGMSGFEYHPADVADRDALARIVEAARPDLVFHLAGIAQGDADLCYRVNLEGTRSLFAALERLAAPPLCVSVSSAAVYGLTRPEESPVHEDVPLRPAAAYGASKAAGELAAMVAHRQGAARVIVARPFNLVGPGLPRGLAAADFLDQIRAIDSGEGPSEMTVGNLEPQRDFVDVRDVVAAYLRLADRPELAGGTFNIASGRGVTIRALLDGLLAASGVEIPVTVDPAKLRPVQVLEQTGSSEKLRRATGWVPAIPLERSLADMVRG